MSMISYAQNAEDVLLNRLFPPGHRGFYIDVGAAHPTSHSVTRHFYDQGWRGINIEPEPDFFAQIVRERSGDRNLNVAVSNAPGRQVLHISNSSRGESTLSPEQAERLRDRGHPIVSHEVEVVTLNEILERELPEATEIDFLKIDVEAQELAVLQGCDFSRWRPKVLVIEADKDRSWEPLVLEAGYLFAIDDGINRFYVRHEDSALLPKLQKPANWCDSYIPYEHLAPRLAVEARVERLRAEGEQSLQALQQTHQSLAEALGQLGACREELQACRDDIASARMELEARGEALRDSRADVDRLVVLLRDLQRDLDAERARASTLARSLADLRGKVLLSDGEIPGPSIIALASQVHRFAKRYPTLSRKAKRLVRAG
jgi:FkbM family methyltransferase